jgi:hypothetical protein
MQVERWDDTMKGMERINETILQLQKIRDSLAQENFSAEEVAQQLKDAVSLIAFDGLTRAPALYEAYPLIAALYPQSGSFLIPSYRDVIATNWQGPGDILRPCKKSCVS